jgi:hypothetical protein
MKYRLDIAESTRGTDWLEFRRESDCSSSWLCSVLKTEIEASLIIGQIKSGKSEPYKMGLFERLVVRFVWKGLSLRKIGSVGSAEVSGATLEFYKIEKKVATEDLLIKAKNYRMGQTETLCVSADSAISALERLTKTTEPNQALQHNDPSCHVSCLRTPRASRGRG